MNIFTPILECLCLGNSTHYTVLPEQAEQPTLEFSQEKPEKHSPQSTQSLAEDILTSLFNAQKIDEVLEHRFQDIVSVTSWYEDLAKAVLNGIENALKAGAPMGQAMKDAYDKAAQVIEEVFQFAKDHPVFVSLIALGILVVLAPWAITALGFGELGPIEGTFAALWQSTYGGFVPARSLFAFFQRLGMVWRL